MGDEGFWKSRLAAINAWVERVSASSEAMRRVRIGRFVFVGFVLLYLAYRLTSIGWGSVIASLPTTPFFYGLVLVMYFLLPTSEALIYSRIWKTGYRKCLSPLLYKRVLNQDVVDYSGEVYLFMWTKDRIALSKRAIAATMKDNLIVSSIISISTAVALLAFLLVTGLIIPTDLVHDPSWMYVAGGAVTAGLLGGLIARFRKAIFSLPRRRLMEMGGIHAARFFIGYALQVLQWWVVVPEASFQSWALLLVLMVVTNRIPFLPSKDLVFVGAGVELSAMLDVPAAAVASMLLVRSLSDKILNLAIFTIYSLRREDPAKSTISTEDNGALGSYKVAPAADEEVPVLNAR